MLITLSAAVLPPVVGVLPALTVIDPLLLMLMLAAVAPVCVRARP